jgi:hypothetical protein
MCIHICKHTKHRMSEDGRPLFLPLSGLMINDRPSGRERVCINPGDSIQAYQSDQAMKYLLYFPKISFGTLALRNLFTVFDMQVLFPDSWGVNVCYHEVLKDAHEGACLLPVSVALAQALRKNIGAHLHMAINAWFS